MLRGREKKLQFGRLLPKRGNRRERETGNGWSLLTRSEEREKKDFSRTMGIFFFWQSKSSWEKIPGIPSRKMRNLATSEKFVGVRWREGKATFQPLSEISPSHLFNFSLKIGKRKYPLAFSMTPPLSTHSFAIPCPVRSKFNETFLRPYLFSGEASGKG